MYRCSARVFACAIVLLAVVSVAEERQAVAAAGALARRYIDTFEFERRPKTW